MASLIDCPHCGLRPREEFTIRGAALPRPAPEAAREVWFAHVYERENVKGAHAEFWHHAAGCRRWLVVTRNTVTHATADITDVTDWRRAGA